MGCHTWFYQKEERSFEEAKKNALKECDEFIKFWFEGDNSNCGQKFTQDEVDHIIKYWKRVKRMIESGVFKDVWPLQPENLKYYHKETETFYIDNDISHDIFRLNEYPPDRFFSYEDLEKWIKENPRNLKIQIDDDGWKMLKKYWEDYPDSMVKFG